MVQKIQLACRATIARLISNAWPASMPTWKGYGNQATQGAAYDRDYQQPLRSVGVSRSRSAPSRLRTNRNFCPGFQRNVLLQADS